MPKYNILEPQHRMIVKYEGLIDLQKLLEKTKAWFDKSQFEFHEYSYKGREPELGELEMFWSGWRDNTEYLRIWINVYIRLWDMQDVEVISDGEKKQMTKARMRINLRSHIETDYRHKWETSRFFELLRDFYEKNIYKVKLDSVIDDTEGEIHSLELLMKNCLAMETNTLVE